MPGHTKVTSEVTVIALLVSLLAFTDVHASGLQSPEAAVPSAARTAKIAGDVVREGLADAETTAALIEKAGGFRDPALMHQVLILRWWMGERWLVGRRRTTHSRLTTS